MAERFGAAELELFSNRLIAVAEEMGAVLQQSGFSPNIKERRDFSCAVFDGKGEMVSHAAHIPVHLGSTPMSVQAALRAVALQPGDIAILNDPYAGGTHLPDVTLVAPVYLAGGRRPYAYVADRAHHADIGGVTPGSMPLSTDVYQEGFRIPPVLLCRDGEYVHETLSLFLANTRVADERRGDLDAQVGALRAGVARVTELATRYGAAHLRSAMAELQHYSARLVRAMIRELPAGAWKAEDVLDGDGLGSGPIPIRVEVSRRKDGLVVDFEGSAPQVRGPLNANLAITTSAVFYVVALLADGSVPANRGMMDPVKIVAPQGSVVNCRFPAGVAGGNVETSQRIVDVFLSALARALPQRIPASSCGTMTNVALGGFDPHRRRYFSYYETVGGGAGGGPRGAGASAIQTHMTNTLNTPVEVLEAYYPVKVIHTRVRRRSGGAGLHPGGDGIDREIEVLCESSSSLLGERRSTRPPGAAGGQPGKPGRDMLRRNGRWRRLAAKSTVALSPGDRLRVETPGGGGWGRGNEKGT